MDADLDEALYQLLSRLEARWLPAEQPGDGVHHAYDPLPLAIFRRGYADVLRFTKPGRFLDVGCGMGTKLALMHYLGWKVEGVERWQPYAAAAREFVPEARITVADAFDVAAFDADVVYTYRPMQTDDDELRLERHLIASMRPGALLWLPARAVRGEIGGERVADELWRA